MRETRIAVVMNGGISLAVWMGGVTHELNRLRLAGGDTEPKDVKEQAVHRAWKAILAKAGAEVVVDTVAGTSAGGLNGTLLATAIARGGDLSGLRETWLERASLEPGNLLRAQPKNAKTLLDGAFFTDEINAAIDKIGVGDFPQQECTLLVTSTAIDSNLAPMILEGGRVDFYRDSRRVFRFQRVVSADGSELNDFEPIPGPHEPGEPSGALTRAARASASFPAAFEPIKEDEALKNQRTPGSPPAGRGWLMDGGVLDNAPFEPLVDALRQRPVGAPFERVLLYVVPSVACRDKVELGSDEAPDVGEVLKAFGGAIREPDQRLDIELLQSSFEQMSFQNSSPHALLARILSDPAHDLTSLQAAALVMLESYKAGRAEAFYRWLTGVGVVAADLRRPDRAGPDSAAIPVVPNKLVPGSPWQWGSSSAERILRWLGRALVQIAADRASSDPDPKLDEAFRELQQSQREARQLTAQLNEAVEERVGADDDYTTRLATFVAVHQQLSRSDPWGDAVTRAATKIAAWLDADADDVVAAALHLEVLSSVFAWGGDEGDVLGFWYLQASPAARSLVSVPVLTTTPDDPDYEAQNQQWACKKLYGERWGHFGAFATAKGREHDWVWGRLDGASALVDMLLGPSADPQLTADLVDAILTAEGSTRDKIETGATMVSTLDNGGLLDLMLAEPNGEERRELILKTVPEVLGEVSALPAAAEGAARVLLAGGEALLDAGEFMDATRTRIRGLIRRIWKLGPWA